MQTSIGIVVFKQCRKIDKDSPFLGPLKNHSRASNIFVFPWLFCPTKILKSLMVLSSIALMDLYPFIVIFLFS